MGKRKEISIKKRSTIIPLHNELVIFIKVFLSANSKKNESFTEVFLYFYTFGWECIYIYMYIDKS